MITFMHKLETGPSVFAPLNSVWHSSSSSRETPGQSQSQSRTQAETTVSAQTMTLAPVGCRSRRGRAKLASNWLQVRSSCVRRVPLQLSPLSHSACLCVAWCGRAVARSFSSATQRTSLPRSLSPLPPSSFAFQPQICWKKLLLICSCSRCAACREIIGTWHGMGCGQAVRAGATIFGCPKCGI